MKIRTLKKFVVARMLYANRFAVQYFGEAHGLFCGAPDDAYIEVRLGRFTEPDWVGHKDPVLVAMVDDLLPDVAAKYQCTKVNGGDLVAEFDTLEEAKALVDKHYRGKKAKLMVLYKGEPVMSVTEYA